MSPILRPATRRPSAVAAVFRLNLKAAKMLGLTAPPLLLVRPTTSSNE
jgi:hypothetical protein